MTSKIIYDVAIVGAGPAGSSCAIRLAQEGLTVLLVEQKQFPRAKLCGEFISPECLSHFAELGVLQQMSLSGSEIARTVFYAQNGRSLAVPNEWLKAGSHALGLSRAEMDDVLLKRARAVGVDVMENTYAAGVLFEDEDVTGLKLSECNAKGFEIRSRLTIDATGRNRAIVRHVGQARKGKDRSRAEFVAFKAHLDHAFVRDGDCEIYAYHGGYGGCVRVENGLHNLCFIVPSKTVKHYGSDADVIVQKVVSKNKRAAMTLANAEIVDNWLAVPIQSYGHAELAPARGLLAIGDSAAFIDPFTGSGILLALESSKLAANVIAGALLANNPSSRSIEQEYKYQYAAAFNARFRTSSLIRRVAFVPFLAHTLISGLAISTRLTRRVAIATRVKTR